mmetsp:Transcript_19159/g.31405  ORF Transcript_19159/g.31405 Transcript_19159/m.31405 type:complete len:209 (+) Transcript_19159:89-715(+)
MMKGSIVVVPHRIEVGDCIKEVERRKMSYPFEIIVLEKIAISLGDFAAQISPVETMVKKAVGSGQQTSPSILILLSKLELLKLSIDLELKSLIFESMSIQKDNLTSYQLKKRLVMMIKSAARQFVDLLWKTVSLLELLKSGFNGTEFIKCITKRVVQLNHDLCTNEKVIKSFFQKMDTFCEHEFDFKKTLTLLNKLIRDCQSHTLYAN